VDIEPRIIPCEGWKFSQRKAQPDLTRQVALIQGEPEQSLIRSLNLPIKRYKLEQIVTPDAPAEEQKHSAG
jgi:hypothetical protein